MSKEKQDINWDLIAKHLSGETDATEEALLMAWVSGSEANRRYFADLKHWWRHVGQLALYGKIDTAADWQKVKQQLKLYEPEQRRETSRLYESERRMIITPQPHFFRRNVFVKWVAATIAMLIIAGAAYYGLHVHGDEQHEMVFNQLVIPPGQQSQLVLADGTSVWLNASSRLQFPANFNSDCRTVKLEGEAYFEVTTDKKRPFIVQTLGLEVKVYGTSFNVTSYSDEASDEVTLLSGSVRVSSAGSGQELVLQPGRKISYLRDTHLFTSPKQADMEAETAWLDGKLVFNDVPFGEIAKKLERRYGVTIRIDDKNIEQLRYRGAFRKESLEQAIKAIQLTANFNYKIEDNLVIIY